MTRVGSSVDVATQSVNLPSKKAQRTFSMSMIISGIRCGLTYVILPFITPFLGLAPGVGPVLGVSFGLVAIAANGYSLHRFWRVRHPWRRPITVLHVTVILFLVVLLGIDVGQLAAVA